MKDFQKIYLQLLNESKNLKSCILQETLLPLFNAKDLSLDLNKNDIFYVNDDMKTEYVIVEEIYKKSIFRSFISDVRKSQDIKEYSINSMKQYLKDKLTPIKNGLNLLIIKYNFHDYDDFKQKILQIFGNQIFLKVQLFLRKNIYDVCKHFSGACWNPSFSNSKNYMFMFLNESFSDITLMHETIYYIQVVTGRSIQKQQTMLQIKNKDNQMFTKSQVVPYINSFCYLLDEHFSKDQILAGFESFQKIMQLSISKNEKISKEQFFKRCLNTNFLKEVLRINPNQQGCIIYILTCIYFRKHISLIKNHLIEYFNDN